MLLDNDGPGRPSAQKENRRCYERLRPRIAGGVVLVTLPAGRDPADLESAEIWRLIRDAAVQQGIQMPPAEMLPIVPTPPPGDIVGETSRDIVEIDPRAIAAHLLNENSPNDFDGETMEALCDEVVNQGLDFVFEKIELPAAAVAAAMMQNGLAVNIDLVESIIVELGQDIANLQRTIDEIAGRHVNVVSYEDVATCLFDELKLPVVRWTRNGRPSIAGAALNRLATDHTIAGLLREHTDYRVVLSAAKSILDAMDPTTRRIHGDLSSIGTATGRFSCKNPPLQALPRVLRQVFCASPGHVFIEADFSQIELRVLAHFSGDSSFTEAFSGRGQSIDLHRRTAAQVLGVAEREVTRRQRDDIGKTVNFALIYGVTAFGLADQLDIDVGEASQFLLSYGRAYPDVMRWSRNVEEIVQRAGFVTTLFGRRRRLPDASSPDSGARKAALRQAVNAIIQGTAADINKLALIRLHRTLPRECRMLLTVHDSVLLEVPETGAVELTQQIQRTMEEPPPNFSIPLEVKVQRGATWEKCSQE